MEAVSLEITPIDQKNIPLTKKYSTKSKNIQPQSNFNLNLSLTQKLDFSSPLTYTYLSNEQQSAIADNFI